jgi:putative tryptophan/tyrosine transport system substrate-binding protein
MRRREFIISLSTASLACSFTVRAQQKAVPVIGFLSAFSPSPGLPSAQFRRALSEAGYVEGQSIAFEHRWADGRLDSLPTMAADLVGLQVSLIDAFGLPAVLAAKAATTTIPIVFWTAGDAVADGLVASLSHPGGNLTGVATFNNALGPKRLELLKELLPAASVFAVLVNPANQNAEPQFKDLQEAGRAKGVQVRALKANSESEIDNVFATIVNDRPDGLIVASDPYLFSQRQRIVALAAQRAIPTIYTVRAYPVAGGLISYTSNPSMDYERASYVGRILKGEKPADLPVQQPTKFELVVNLKTAKAIGLTVPPTILARADEVIE